MLGFNFATCSPTIGINCELYQVTVVVVLVVVCWSNARHTSTTLGLRGLGAESTNIRDNGERKGVADI